MSPPDDKQPGPPEVQPDEGREGYPIEPPIPRSEDCEPVVYVDGDEDPFEPIPPARDRYQFSLFELLVVMTALSLLMSFLGLFPSGYSLEAFAGMAGSGVLLGLIVLSILKPDRAVVTAAWGVLLIFYVAACAFALWQSR